MREIVPGRSTEMALTGGEDYELLFTGESGRIERLRDRLGCPVTIIGSITAGHPGEVRVLDAHNKQVRVRQPGWDHYGKPG
jgi:thiamine-monophosphate kinase